MTGGWRQHRRTGPALLSAGGLGLLALGLAGHKGWLGVLEPGAADRWVTSAGAIGLAAAQLANWRVIPRCGRTEKPRVGNDSVDTCSIRWARDNYKKIIYNRNTI